MEQARQHLASCSHDAVLRLATLAVKERIHPLFCLVSETSGDQLEQVDPDIAQILRRTPIYYFHRNLRLRAELQVLDVAMNDNDEKPLLLKGSARLFDDIYPLIGCRHMEDIDVCVTDNALLKAIAGLEEDQIDPAEMWFGPETGAVQLDGKHHWPPLTLGKHGTSIEPHFLPFDCVYQGILPEDFFTNVGNVEGLNYFAAPSMLNQTVVAIVHAIKHDRDSFPGSLFLKGLIETELLYQRLSDEEKSDLKAHFRNAGFSHVYDGWSELIQFVFEIPCKDSKLSLRSRALLAEFQLRKHKKIYALIIGTIHRLRSWVSPSNWRSGAVLQRSREFKTKRFWVRAYREFRNALRFH